MRTTAPHTRLDEIRNLDPANDHQRIAYLIGCYEFPWDVTRSLELALFRTFCVPRTSQLLDRTGEFRRQGQKRYDDTDIIVSEMIEWGYDSDRGRAALRKMNQLHSRFEIANEDYLYVLSTFVYVPIHWIEQYGWRSMCREERLGWFHFWRQVGRRMGIDEIPCDYDAFERYSEDFERAQFRFSETNHRLATSVLEMFKSWFPLPLRPLADASIRAMMDEAMIKSFGLREPPAMMRRCVTASLRLRARAVRWLPRRKQPRLRTQGKHRTYPDGYSIDRLGPPRM